MAEFGITADEITDLKQKAKISFGDFVQHALFLIVGEDTLMYCAPNWKLDGIVRPPIPNSIKEPIIGMLYYEKNSLKNTNDFSILFLLQIYTILFTMKTRKNQRISTRMQNGT